MCVLCLYFMRWAFDVCHLFESFDDGSQYIALCVRMGRHREAERVRGGQHLISLKLNGVESHSPHMAICLFFPLVRSLSSFGGLVDSPFASHHTREKENTLASNVSYNVTGFIVCAQWTNIYTFCVSFFLSRFIFDFDTFMWFSLHSLVAPHNFYPFTAHPTHLMGVWGARFFHVTMRTILFVSKTLNIQ